METSPKQVELSVIIPVRNAAEDLPDLLLAFDRQTLSTERYELLIVDDCSTDSTPEVIDRHPHATLLRAPRHGGSYAARNFALQHAQAPLIAFTDGDCTPSEDWLERGLERLAAGPARLVAGHVEVPLGEHPSAVALVDFSRHLNQERAVRDGFGATANLWAFRVIFDSIGTFNEKLISGGDTELGHRAGAAGFQVEYAPDVAVSHPPRSHGRELARKAYRLGFGAAQHRKHAEGPLRTRNRIYLHPGAYKPGGKLPGLDRLERHGIRLTTSQHARMKAVSWLYVQLPMCAGNFSGAWNRGPLALERARAQGLQEAREPS